jgi:hypothetical protein
VVPGGIGVEPGGTGVDAPALARRGLLAAQGGQVEPGWNRVEPGGTGWNQVEPGGTRWNLVEPGWNWGGRAHARQARLAAHPDGTRWSRGLQRTAPQRNRDVRGPWPLRYPAAPEFHLVPVCMRSFFCMRSFYLGPAGWVASPVARRKPAFPAPGPLPCLGLPASAPAPRAQGPPVSAHRVSSLFGILETHATAQQPLGPQASPPVGPTLNSNTPPRVVWSLISLPPSPPSGPPAPQNNSEYNTLEKLLTHEQVHKFCAWAAKQKARGGGIPGALVKR